MNIQREKEIFYIGEQARKDAYISFVEKDNILTIEHTVVSEPFKGKGVGSLLVKEVVDYARENGFKLRSTCWFAEKLLKEVPEYADILATERQ